MKFKSFVSALFALTVWISFVSFIWINVDYLGILIGSLAIIVEVITFSLLCVILIRAITSKCRGDKKSEKDIES